MVAEVCHFQELKTPCVQYFLEMTHALKAGNSFGLFPCWMYNLHASLGLTSIPKSILVRLTAASS